MAETFPYNVEFVNECRRMDEIWVPSKFSRDTLIASGVEPEKLRILPIAVDVSAFDPVAFAPLKLPFGERMLGGSRRLEMPTWEQMQSQEITAEIIPELDFLSFDTEADYQRHEVKTWGSASPQEKFDSPPPTALAKIILTQTRKRKAQSKHRTRPNKTLVNRRRGKPYVFVSVFKWEMR